MSGAVPFTTFVKEVLGVVLTPAQRVLCAVAYDGVQPRDLAGEERDIAAKLFGPVETVSPEQRHVIAVVAGARGGKSYVLCALRLLYLALTVLLDTLAPGETASALVVAPDLRLARQTIRYILGAVKATKAIASRMCVDAADSLTLRREGGRTVTIECLPATRGGSAVRGRSLVGAVLDEACFFRDESFTVNDAEVFKAVAPRIMPGGQLIIASTPWSSAGLLFELHRDNFGAPRACLAAHAPTALLRGDARTLAMVERERERDPDNARREFDAVFMSGNTASFFSSDAIDRAVDPGLSLPAFPVSGATVTAGGDFGFRSDSSALAIVRWDNDVAVLVALEEMRPSAGQPLQPSAVVSHFASLLRKYGAPSLISDGHYREAVVEYLDKFGLTFTPAPEGATGKVDVFTKARTLLHEGKVRLPDDKRLLRQLREVVSRPLPGGGLSITSPRWRTGGHGDLVSAWVLAVARSGHMPGQNVFDWYRINFGPGSTPVQSAAPTQAAPDPAGGEDLVSLVVSDRVKGATTFMDRKGRVYAIERGRILVRPEEVEAFIALGFTLAGGDQ
jgi:hypothetical protein